MADKFASKDKQLADPATRHFAITNGVEFSQFTRAIYVGTDGDIAIRDLNNDVVIYKNAKAGSIIPIRAKEVVASGTTATNLVGLW